MSTQITDLVRRPGEALVIGTAQKAPEITPAHFAGLAKLIGGLPVGNLLALIEGRATLNDGIDLLEQAARIVGAAFPPAAITVGEVEFGLEALKFICGAAGLGAAPLHVSPGQNPIRGGFEGARGHL